MLIKKDPDIIIPYLKDYSNINGGFCDCVIFPETEEEVTDTIKSASAKKIPTTISAAGTGVTGARIPFGGQVLSVEKMNRILDIERLPSGEGTALIEPAVLLKDFLERAEREGLFYPPDTTEKGSFLCGNVATSASGARSFRFGTTRNYVLGLRVVLPTGELLEIERGKIFAKDRVIELPLVSGKTLRLKLPDYNMPNVKNAAGYYIKDNMDAIDLFIGQEGTLGVITKVKLKLLKGLGSLLDCCAFFDKQRDALSFAYSARKISLKNRGLTEDINAISLEFLDENSLQLLRQRHKNIPKAARGAVYFEQEISKESEPGLLNAWARLIEECGGSLDNTWFAQSKNEKDRLRSMRHDLPEMVNEFIKRRKLAKVGTDIAVRHEYIDDMIGYYNESLAAAGLRYVIFGHIGDSHLHVNILPENEQQHKKAKDIYNLFVKKAVSYGGTVSAEHGIGKLKHSYLEAMYGKDAIMEMARLKKSVDPACILGLDNIFPKKMLNQD